MFTVDEYSWTLPCDIKRIAEMKPSDISGFMLNRAYFSDVLGTYLSYEVKIVVPFGGEIEYNQLYEILTSPEGSHTFKMPYGNGTITITGRVEKVNDLYTRLADGTIHWRGITFTVIANNPSKYMSLGDVVTDGLEPLPSAASVNVGDAYIYTQSGWSALRDADVLYY